MLEAFPSLAARDLSNVIAENVDKPKRLRHKPESTEKLDKRRKNTKIRKAITFRLDLRLFEIWFGSTLTESSACLRTWRARGCPRLKQALHALSTHRLARAVT